MTTLLSVAAFDVCGALPSGTTLLEAGAKPKPHDRAAEGLVRG